MKMAMSEKICASDIESRLLSARQMYEEMKQFYNPEDLTGYIVIF